MEAVEERNRESGYARRPPPLRETALRNREMTFETDRNYQNGDESAEKKMFKALFSDIANEWLQP